MRKRGPADRRPLLWHWAFALTTLLGAFLLFEVQPLISKAILPWFGGGPGVWTTAMLFFQLLLLGGYLYAHLLCVRFSVPVQALVHCAVLLAAASLLPILPNPSWQPQNGEDPLARIFLLLAANVGLPYFALATTGPLLQRWFSLLMPERSPYGLYALSNIGSLLALLSYPVLFERLFDTPAQAELWSSAFVLFALAAANCSVVSWRAAPGVTALAPPEHASPSAGAAPQLRDHALWFGLALIPSAMLLATTNQLCIDVAAVPFLWLAPLTVYLLSFILCFGQVRVYRRTIFVVLWLLVTPALCIELIAPATRTLPRQLGVFLLALGVCAMLCHGELSLRRPHPRHLTAFYLAISAGGAAGGVLVAVIAPRILHGYFELHLAVLGCYALLLMVLLQGQSTASSRRLLLFTTLGALGTSLGLLGAVRVVGVGDRGVARTLAQSRSFYGVLRVAQVSDARVLTHGRTWHGMQFAEPARRSEPTLYFTHQSGIGLLLDSIAQRGPARVGVVGLGVGTLAAYGRAGDVYRFYELDPNVLHMAKTYFTFLRDTPASVQVALGDARISLSREAPNRFDILVLDAFSSDSVPTHLLTLEAVELYLRHLVQDGVLVFNLTNRYLDLSRVIAGAAQRLGLTPRIVQTEPDAKHAVSRSTWAFLARQPGRLAFGSAAPIPSKVLWTDAHNALFEVLHK